MKALATMAILSLAAAASAGAAGPAGAPFPGGKYRGALDGDRVELKADADLDTSVSYGSGKLVLHCGGGLKRRVRFSTGPDGGFRAKKQNRGGKTVLRVHGRFAGMEGVRGKVVRARGNRCERGRFAADLVGPSGLEKHVVTYGPYPTEPSMGMGHEAMKLSAKRLAGADGSGTVKVGHNVVKFDVPKPCEDCYVVGMIPDLVDAGGNSLKFDDQAMLHHIVFSDSTEQDATCGKGWALGERFFASGNERTPTVLPRGFGYKVDAGDSWSTVAHLMNMGEHPRDLYVSVTYYTLPAQSGTQNVEPFWLDIDNCRDSQYSIPAGRSTTSKTFEVTPQWDGRIVALGGHLHDGGVEISAVDQTSGQLLCNSVAGYGHDQSYMGHVETLSGCLGDVGTLDVGDTIRLDSTYDSPTASDDVMGIMVGYVAPGD